jgi:hypothetical protein
MTAALGNTAQGTPFATGVDAFVYPQFLGTPLRAPTTQDIYNPGTRWQDNSVNPAVQYYTIGAGIWYEIPNTSFGVSSITGTANQILATPNVGSVVLSLIGPYTPATYTAHGVLIGEGTGSIVATATGSAGQFLVSNGSSADPTFQTATPQLTVTPVAGTSQAMVVNTNYIANAVGQTTFTLPTTAAVGSIISIVGSALNTGGWKVTYTTGQIIWGPAGSSTVTTGNASSAAAAAQCMKIMCVVANTTWVIQDNSGTITLT